MNTKIEEVGIPLTEQDTIKKEYLIALNELEDLHNKLSPIIISTKQVKTLRSIISQLVEEFTTKLVEDSDYNEMLNRTSVIKNNFRIFHKEITDINAFHSQDIVKNMYQSEKESGDGSDISDDYHTMSELYFNRLIMFDMICKTFPSKAWKSKLHDDGTMFDNYFIVGISTPEGEFTYHYHMKFWDIFTCKEIPNAPKWDGHTPKDISRLYSLLVEKGE